MWNYLFPSYLTDTSTWVAIWPLPATAVIIAFILAQIQKPKTVGHRWFVKWFVVSKHLFLSILAFSMLGLVIGTIAGSSIEPVMGAVLPAILSLVGGLAIYFVGKEQTGSNATYLVVLSVLALSTTLLLGAFWGAVLKAEYKNYLQSVEYLEDKSYKEAQVARYRKQLGLPISSTQPPSQSHTK